MTKLMPSRFFTLLSVRTTAPHHCEMSAPEVQIFDIIEDFEKGSNDCLIMGSDGLWDVLSNEDVRRIVRRVTTASSSTDSPDLFGEVSRVLVETARGQRMPELYWEMPNGKLASGDDITVFAIPVRKAYRNIMLRQ